jgi:HEAT repeat protein
VAGPAFACLGLSGCANFWDNVTSREFKFDSLFVKSNPLLELRDSTDGDHRARALRSIYEPLRFGGTVADQEAMLKILNTAASTEKQPLCRLAAIQSLGRFQDPRAVQGLTDAFYNASSFSPETTTVIRCQALSALGQTKNPAAIELLARVVREPPAEGPDHDKQQALDVRIAAAKSLSNFTNFQATDALVRVLETEKDVALRDRAHESLQTATGKKLPPDAKAWDELLHEAGGQPAPDTRPKILQAAARWFE